MLPTYFVRFYSKDSWSSKYGISLICARMLEFCYDSNNFNLLQMYVLIFEKNWSNVSTILNDTFEFHLIWFVITLRSRVTACVFIYACSLTHTFDIGMYHMIYTYIYVNIYKCIWIVLRYWKAVARINRIENEIYWRSGIGMAGPDLSHKSFASDRLHDVYRHQMHRGNSLLFLPSIST